MTVIALHKPYGVLCRFTPEPSSDWRTLAEFGLPPRVYPVGRLDADSEGLLILTDDARLNRALLHPSRSHPREYWAQVEGVPSAEALARLRAGVVLSGRPTLPAQARHIVPAPEIPARTPPIRVRASIPDSWIALELTEGRNRQVRRMTAAVGCPTLRLIRVRIGRLRLGDLGLAPGEWRRLTPPERALLLEP